MTIAADPCHLGARIATATVLNTWGLARSHRLQVHMSVSGSEAFAIASDAKRGRRWWTKHTTAPPFACRSRAKGDAEMPGNGGYGSGPRTNVWAKGTWNGVCRVVLANPLEFET